MQGTCKQLADLFNIPLTRILQSILGKTVKTIAQSYTDIWRFLTFDASSDELLRRKNYYRIFSRLCKPLLISLARLFFTLFRGFIQVCGAL
jgi:hypothetical protein